MYPVKYIAFAMIVSVICFAQIGCGGKCIKGDCEDGQGTRIYSTGSRYTGEWKDSLPDGKGTMIYANGERYVSVK